MLNGILLARVRSDISLAEFETGVRDLVSNVENAYWDLYFAYRDLDAKKKARDNALETYREVEAQAAARTEKGTQEKLSQALEQYWRFEAEVVNALNGRLEEGTRTNNGSGGGTARTPAGVRTAERRLRLIIGMPVNGAELIRPSDEPSLRRLSSIGRRYRSKRSLLRPELRRQRWRIKQRELELLASRNFLLPRLDAIARYRFRGFGESLISQSDAPFSSAYGDLAGGDFQEWQLGMELEVPIGYRQGHAAVRNAEHVLARERAVLREQKRQVIYGLSTALGDVKRAYAVAQAQYNRWHAANEQLVVMQNLWEEGSPAVRSGVGSAAPPAGVRDSVLPGPRGSCARDSQRALRTGHAVGLQRRGACGRPIAGGSLLRRSRARQPPQPADELRVPGRRD